MNQDVMFWLVLCLLFIVCFGIELLGAAWVWAKLMHDLRHEPGVAGVLIGAPMLSVGFWGTILIGFPLFKMMLATSLVLLCGGLMCYGSYNEEQSFTSSVGNS